VPFSEGSHPPDDFGGAPVILQNIAHDISFSSAMSGLGDFRIASAFRHSSK
jgi:hypothetical protein